MRKIEFFSKLYYNKNKEKRNVYAMSGGTKMKKDKPIFSRVIKERLESLGFTVRREVPNYKKPGQKVYFFEATDALLDAFDKILKGEEIG